MTKSTVEAREVTIGGKMEHFRLKREDGKGVQVGRKYFVTTIPFCEARDLFSPDYFNVKTGKGEQRVSATSQLNKIKRAMLEEDFTPCAVHVSMKKHHQEKVVIDEQGNASITISTNDPLPLPNGNHRFNVLNDLRTFYTDSHDEEGLKLLDQIPITAVVLTDGSSQKDFSPISKREKPLMVPICFVCWLRQRVLLPSTNHWSRLLSILLVVLMPILILRSLNKFVLIRARWLLFLLRHRMCKGGF